MPRVKSFEEKYGTKKTNDRDARIAGLPQEIQDEVAKMSPEGQDQYFASLDRVDEMAAKGEEMPLPKHGGYFSPQTRARGKFIRDATPEAPFGYTKSGEPKKRPGRKAAPEPGARTAEKMERFVPEMDLSVLAEDHPEDDPDVLTSFNTARHQEAAKKPPAPKALTEDEREAAERAQREAELRAALEARGIKTDNVLAGPFDAVQLRPQGDPDDLENYSVERVPCKLRLIDTGKEYELQVQFEGRPWEHLGGPSQDPSGGAAAMARRRIRPVDFSAFSSALAQLPNPHPARYFKVTYGSSELAPKTPAEREARNREIQEQMARQRRINAMHRGNYEVEEPPHNHAFLDHFLAH